MVMVLVRGFKRSLWKRFGLNTVYHKEKDIKIQISIQFFILRLTVLGRDYMEDHVVELSQI